MDAAHEADLARILENRRKRGVSAGYQSSIHYGRFPESFGREPMEMEESKFPARTQPYVGRMSPSPINQAADQQEASLNSPQIASPNGLGRHQAMAAETLSTVADRRYASPKVERTGNSSPASQVVSSPTSISVKQAELLLTEQRQLRQLQFEQEKKMEEISRNMNKNFGDLMSALNARSHSTATTPADAASHWRSMPGIGSTWGSQANPASHVFVPGTVSRALKAESDYFGEGQLIRSPQTNRKRDERSTVGTLPPPLAFPKGPVVGATPSSATHLDLKSAMAVLKTGEWFIKWDGRRIQAAARYVWYDYTRCALYWGPEKFTRSPLGGYLAIEEIASVTTDQMTEFDGEVDRLFFLLIINTPKRRLYLATEKRAKLDAWYEALTIVSLFNRMNRSGTAHKSLSSD